MVQKLTKDPEVELYVKGFKKADELVYSKHDNYYMAFPYFKNVWLDDKLCFNTEDEVLEFCNKLNIKAIKDF